MVKIKTSPGGKPNYLYAIISVTLVLVLIGFFGLIMMQANQILKMLQEDIDVLVEIKPDADPLKIDALENFLKTAPFTKDGTVEFVSKNEGAEIMKEEFGEDFMKLDMPNPLYDIYSFNVKSRYMNTDSLRRIKAQIKRNEDVSDVFYQESLTDVISQNLHRIGWIALGCGIFLIAIAVFLIHNTIRLALYANRFLIKNMELAGASWSFISRPFLKRSLIHGALSGLLALLFLGVIQFFIMRDLPELQSVIPVMGFVVIALLIIVSGILITAVSTYYVVNKYLKMRVDEMY